MSMLNFRQVVKQFCLFIFATCLIIMETHSIWGCGCFVVSQLVSNKAQKREYCGLPVSSVHVVGCDAATKHVHKCAPRNARDKQSP